MQTHEILALLDVDSGLKVGQNVMSGGRLSECAGEENPCRQAYIDYLGYGEQLETSYFSPQLKS